MESNPALSAILTGISDPAERERIARAFHSLSQGDEMSYPVVFALVANGAARSVAESAAIIKVCSDRFPNAEAAQPRTVVTEKGGEPNTALIGLIAGLLVAGAGIWGGFAFFKSRFETKAAALASQYTQSAELVETLRAGGGALRFYAARDESGKKVRLLAVDGGKNGPREAFLNAAGQAIVLLPDAPP